MNSHFCVCDLVPNCVRLFAAPWIAALQVTPSVGFSRQEHWSGLPFPSPEDLPNPGIQPRSLALQVDSLQSEPLRKPYINSHYHPSSHF